jgi:AcrR family transcriptional regulator
MASGTRDRLLEAAAHVVMREGTAAVTLDAVASEAGVSKGGLLYHFPTKMALLEAVTERWHERFDAAIDAKADGAPGGWTRAYLAASDFNGEDARTRGDEYGLMVALAAEPRLLARAHRHYDHWQARVENDGIDPVLATIVRLASDGLWFAELLRLAPPKGQLRRRVLEHLRQEIAKGVQTE